MINLYSQEEIKHLEKNLRSRKKEATFIAVFSLLLLVALPILRNDKNHQLLLGFCILINVFAAWFFLTYVPLAINRTKRRMGFLREILAEKQEIIEGTIVDIRAEKYTLKGEEFYPISLLVGQNDLQLYWDANFDLPLKIGGQVRFLCHNNFIVAYQFAEEENE